MSFALAPGETELRRWRISRKAFALRTGALLIVTLIALAPLGFYVSWSGTILSALVLVPTYMWVLDDFKIWRTNASTTWLLTDLALHIDRPDEDDASTLRLPLEKIASVSRWPLWSLVLRLDTGVALTLPLVRDPRRLRADILKASSAAIER